MSVELSPRLGKLDAHVLKHIEIGSDKVFGPALLGMDRFPAEHDAMITLHAMARINFLSRELRAAPFSGLSPMVFRDGDSLSQRADRILSGH